jgi:hypothetical protein
MILTLFIVLLVLSLATIVISQYTNAPPLSLTGYLFVFILGLVLLTGNVEYKSGEITSYTYLCGGQCFDNRSSTYFNLTNAQSVSSEIKTDTYTNYSGEVVSGIMLHHVFGFFMSILAAFGFVITLLHLKQSDDVTRL